MIRGPPRSPLFPYPPLFRSLSAASSASRWKFMGWRAAARSRSESRNSDRKRTRLNSSHIPLSRMPSSFFNDTRTSEVSPFPLPAALPFSVGSISGEPLEIHGLARGREKQERVQEL